jgi:ATP-dependent Clp protease ATP-binding subunit ClpX
LTEPKNALVKQYKKLLEYDNVELEFEPKALEVAADKAVDRGIGARGLRAVLEAVMTDVMYHVPSDPSIVKVTITAESMAGESEPVITRDEKRTNRPRLGSSGAAKHGNSGKNRGNIS